MGFRIVAVLREKISGTADQNDREGLNEALELARTGKIKKVLVHEVSRIARRNSIAHKFVETLEDYGVSSIGLLNQLRPCCPRGGEILPLESCLH